MQNRERKGKTKREDKNMPLSKLKPKPRTKIPLRVPMALPPAAAGPIPIEYQETPKVQWVIVTPELAMKWLDEANVNNRKVREDHVYRLAQDMAAGKWHGKNAEPIKFDKNGRMFEGQHRCWACVQSNTPFETLLVTGCDPSDYETSGIGRPKYFGDFLGPVHGEKNVFLLAATIRLVWIWQSGSLGSTNNRSVQPTIQQMEVTFKDNPGIRESVNRVSNMHATRKLLTASFCALIHYAGTLEGKGPTVDSFLERLGTGLGLVADDPIYQLRKFLLSQKGPKPGTRRSGQMYVLALAIKCWNACKMERPIKQLSFRTDEEFPQL